VPSRNKLKIINELEFTIKTMEDVQGNENKYFGLDTRSMGESVYTEGFEGAEGKDGGPPEIQREREMDEELISVGRWSMVLIDDTVDVLIICVKVDQNSRGKGEIESHSHCGADKQIKDETYN
jgi:hypothetical protein